MHDVEIHVILNGIAGYVFALLASLFAFLSFYHLYFLAAVVSCLYLIALVKLTAASLTNKITSIKTFQLALKMNRVAIGMSLIFLISMSAWFLKNTEFAKADILFFLLFVVMPAGLVLGLLIKNINVLRRLISSLS